MKLAVPPTPGSAALEAAVASQASGVLSQSRSNPGSPALQSDVGSRWKEARRRERALRRQEKEERRQQREARKSEGVSNRQRYLNSRFMAHQAKEVNDNDESVEGSSNSEDDGYFLLSLLLSCLYYNITIQLSDCATYSHCTDESNVTHGSDHPVAPQNIYMESLSSQGHLLGFGTPMHLQRGRARFISSFDPSARLPDSPAYSGLYCPNGHRLRDRLYTNSGRHCDECETPLENGDAGKFCQVLCCPTQTAFALSHSMFQPCDYDVCAECARQMGSSPPLPRQSPQANLVAVPAGSSPPLLVAVPASAVYASPLTPSPHPVRQQLFPIFFTRAPAPPVSHEVLFNAAAASPLRPSGRQTGRLRLRVSTPPQLLAEVTSVPRLQHRRSVTLSSPDLHASRLASILTITTPPRVGFPGFVPCQLFPDSPIPSILLIHQSVGTDVVASVDACVQTDLQSPPPTSPRLDQPATLRDVRNELRALLIGLGF